MFENNSEEFGSGADRTTSSNTCDVVNSVCLSRRSSLAAGEKSTPKWGSAIGYVCKHVRASLHV